MGRYSWGPQMMYSACSTYTVHTAPADRERTSNNYAGTPLLGTAIFFVGLRAGAVQPHSARSAPLRNAYAECIYGDSDNHCSDLAVSL